MEKNLLQKAEKILENKLLNRHSYFQLKYFVIGKEPTLQGKMNQCLLEIQDRKDKIESLNLQIEDSKDDLELLNLQINNESSNKAQEIEKKKLNRKIIALEKNLKNLEIQKTACAEEMEFFLIVFENIDKQEPFKSLDDEESQKEYWNAKLQEEFQLRTLLQSPLDLELVKTTLAMPDESPVKKNLMAALINMQRMLSDKKKEAIHEEAN